jgi:hypothetical protein
MERGRYFGNEFAETATLPKNGEWMSDYLGNLAAKSLGLVDVLQPRFISMFEPLPTNVLMESNRFVAQENIEQNVETYKEDPITLRRQAVPYPFLAQQQTAVLPTINPASKIEPETQKPPVSIPAEPIVSINNELEKATREFPQESYATRLPIAEKIMAPLHQEKQITTTVIASPVVQSLEPIPVSNTTLGVEQVLQKTESTSSNILLPTSQFQTVVSVLGHEATPVTTPSPELLETPSQPRTISTHLAERKVVKPQVTLAQPSRSLEHTEAIEQAISPSEPIVHVTIGRIEVRAVTSNTSPKGFVPAKPVMSLDEYLQKCHGSSG